ncbi:MAG: 50S ribosomal protein L4, partial [Oscillospiraceae bacterium]|nr:50S ribosomal protein L4 [Oscillospiraceae bacterium]
MPKANLYNMAGEQVGEIELSEAVFGIEPNVPAMHAVVKSHLAACRQ